MGEFSHLRVGGSAAINLSYDGLRKRTAHVIQPGFDGDFGGGFGAITKAEENNVFERIEPDSGFQLGRDLGQLEEGETAAINATNARHLASSSHNLPNKL